MSRRRMAGVPKGRPPGPEIDLDACSDWRVESGTHDWAVAQRWLCFGCGRPLTAAGETFIKLTPPGVDAQSVPLVVHGECAVMIERSGLTLGMWLERLRQNTVGYDERRASAVLGACLERRGLLALAPAVVDVVDEDSVELVDLLKSDGEEDGEDDPPVDSE